MTEDQYANALMHDQNLVFSVRLHCMPMRHRKPNSWDATMAPVSRPLASAVLDLMVILMEQNYPNNVIHISVLWREMIC